jgi:hypothetical protein
MAIIQFLIAILATYRMAQILPEEDGPFFVFTRIRSFISTKRMMENEDLGFWAAIDEWASCPYCQGIYMALLVSLLILWQNYYGNVFLLIFAIAGGQSLLQKWSGE